jgi:type I restriction enzyme S subunit
MWEALVMADDRKPKEQQGLPEGWKWVRLGEVAKITTGNSNVQDASDDGVYPFFDRSGEIKRSERYFLDTEAVIVPGEGSDFFPKYFKGKFDLHQRTYAIFNFKGLDGRFLYYLMHLLRVNLIRTAVGTTVLSLRLPHFQNLELPLPPLPEQRKIAQILETVDNAIEKTEKIIEKYKRIKQGLMQDLLTKGIDEKGNIRSEKTHKFKDSPLGRIPEEWEVVTINSIIKDSLISGIWGEEPKDFENTYPILRSTEISHEGRIVIKNVAFRKVKLGPSKISKYVLRNGDILIVSSSGSEELIGRVAIFKYPGNEKFLFSNFLLRLRVGEKTDSTYMFYLLSSFWYRYFLSQFQETSTGLRNFPKNEFLNYFFFPLPPLSEQKRIAEILSQIDQAIEKEEKYKEKLERLKKGLMEDLLTGKVRVNKLLEGESHGMA